MRGRESQWAGRARRAAVAATAAALLLLAAGCGDDGESNEGGSDGYLETVLRSKDLADATACQAQLKALATTLATWAAEHGGKFPAALDGLVASGDLSPRQLHCPSRKGKRYVYIAGQKLGMPGDNVLVYEDTPVHDGKCHVLRLSGAVEALNPEDLRAAVERTRERLP